MKQDTTTLSSDILRAAAKEEWIRMGQTSKPPEVTADKLRAWILNKNIERVKQNSTLEDTPTYDLQFKGETILSLMVKHSEPDDWQLATFYRTIMCCIQHTIDVPIQTREGEQRCSETVEGSTSEKLIPFTEITNSEEISLRMAAQVALTAIFEGWNHKPNSDRDYILYDVKSLEDGVVAIHKLWHTVKEEHKDEFLHPIEPIVKEWLIDNIPKIEPEKRKDTGIAPEGLRTATRYKQSDALEVGNLPTSSKELQLPLFAEIADTQIVPALPLELYEAVAGASQPAGRGAPISQRIFINALLAYPIGKRQDNAVKLTTTLRDIKKWLYPNGNRNSHQDFIEKLRKALLEVHNYRISWERREWHIIAVDALPTAETKLDDPLPFTIKLPEGMSAANGAMVKLHPLRHYGATSAPKFRAWIRLAYIWDKAKIRNGGYRIYATIPKVKRNDNGYLIDQNDELIRSGDPYYYKGNFQVKNGNALQTAWYHPYAVVIGAERNPQNDKVPVLSDTDLIQLFYDDKHIKRSNHRKRLHEAKRHALEMESDGHIVIEQDAVDHNRGIKGWRILEPREGKIDIES